MKKFYSNFVATLPVSVIEAYAATDPSEQFDFARNICLQDNDCGDDMDAYDAMEIALDTRATDLGIF